VGAVEHHERVPLGLVGLLALGVGQADDLVASVAVQVGDRRRRLGPLQPHPPAHVRPGPAVQVQVVAFDGRREPADELPPAHAAPLVGPLAVPEPGRGEHRGAVVVEQVDLVVIEGHDDLPGGVVVQVPDAHVEPVRAVPPVALPVEAAVGRAVAGPGARRRARGAVGTAGGVQDEHLRAGPGGVRRGHHHLHAAVAVEVGGGHAARLGALAAAAGGGRPAGHRAEPRGGEPVGGHRALAAAHHDLPGPVAVQVGHHRRRVDAAPRGRPRAQPPSGGVEDEGRVGRRDDLQAPVAGEVHQPRRGEPAGLAGGDAPDVPRAGDRGGGGRGGRAHRGGALPGGGPAAPGGPRGGDHRDRRHGEWDGAGHGANLPAAPRPVSRSGCTARPGAVESVSPRCPPRGGGSTRGAAVGRGRAREIGVAHRMGVPAPPCRRPGGR
jgi:hypothetical protein